MKTLWSYLSVLWLRFFSLSVFQPFSLMSLPNPFNTPQAFSASGASHKFYSLPALESAGFKVSRLPLSIRLVLESLLRNCDGQRVAEPAVRALASWVAKASRTEE